MKGAITMTQSGLLWGQSVGTRTMKWRPGRVRPREATERVNNVVRKSWHAK